MLVDIFVLVLVGIIWGSTNYLIEFSYKDYDNIIFEKWHQKLIQYLMINIKPFLLFLLNQSGSLLFYICLGKISKFKSVNY
jgi:hypothetical protein